MDCFSNYYKFYNKQKLFSNVLLEHNEYLDPMFERVDDGPKLKLARDICNQIDQFLKTIKKDDLIQIANYKVIDLNLINYKLKLAFIDDINIEYIAAHGKDDKNKNVIAINLSKVPIAKKSFEAEKYDYTWKAFGSYAVHEIIHFLDDIRTNSRISNNIDNNKNKYPNYPSEFNAFFMEFFDHFNNIIQKIDNLKDFNKIIGNNASDFITKFNKNKYVLDSGYLKALKNSENYTKKFNKRLYQLYYYLYDMFTNRISPEKALKETNLNESSIISIKNPSIYSNYF